MLSSFDDWGIPTAVSIAEVCHTLPFVDVIASGGIQNGQDIAKSIALGASAVGLAGYFLKILDAFGIDRLISEIKWLLDELRIIMTALGRRTIPLLQKAPIVIRGNTHHWLTERGIKTEQFAQR